MTKNPHSLTRRAFFRAAVSLPIVGVVAGIAGKSDAARPVEETQAVHGHLISLSVNGREIAPRSLWSLSEVTTGSALGDMQVLALLS